MKKLYLIDISSYFFRSYYAVPPHMTSPKGLPTNALYGVLSMLLKLIEEKKPDYIVSCFDSKTPSFRNQIFPEYKANREKMPEDLQAQVPYLKILVKLLGIHSLEQEGFEADDLIGTMTEFGRRHNLNVIILSGDKDFTQLVDKDTVLFDSMKSKTYDINEVKKKWGVLPRQMIDYLALVGDSSDNIPGVRGIGPKGAVQLLTNYSDLKSIYENLDTLKDSIKKKLKEGKSSCSLSKDLVTLRKDIKVSCKLPELAPHFSKSQELKDFLKELGFASFLKNLYSETSLKNQPALPSEQKNKTISRITPKTSSPVKTNFLEEEQLLLNQKDFKISQEKKPYSSLKFFSSLEPYSSLWIWLQGKDLYAGNGKKLTVIRQSEMKEVRSILDSKWIRYCGYDLKKCWKKLGCKQPIPEWDAMIASHLLDSSPSISFSWTVKKYLNLEEPKTPEETCQAHKALRKQLEKNMESHGVFPLFRDIEIPLITVLHNMEEKGVLIDSTEVDNQSLELDRDLRKLEQEIYRLAGEEFKINSPKQLGGLLFEKLNLPKGRKIKSGFSTDSQTLMKIKNRHPILPFLLDYRELFKLKSTYIEALSSLAHPETGRIHTSFQQTATATGRLSSIHPNLQNIPIRTFRGRQIRKCFAAPENFLLISADYSQIELRILAHITEDPGLCQAFQNDLDVHAVTASEIFHVPLKEVTPDLRSKSKAVNFGIAYGQGAYGLAEFLRISRNEAKEIINSYFKKFKKVKDYIESTREDAFRKGYVTTLFGRKRFFQPQEFQNPRIRSLSERAAINAPIQGSASDLVKKAMIELGESLPIPILSQVHDELLFECPKNEIQKEISFIRPIMEHAASLKIPLKINIASGKTWEEAHS